MYIIFVKEKFQKTNFDTSSGEYLISLGSQLFNAFWALF